MKKIKYELVSFLLIINYLCVSQNVGINSTGANPHPSALLDVDASPNNNSGFLIPRLSTSQRLAISSPAIGLQVYDTNLQGIYMYYGTKWDCLNNPAGTVQYFANILVPIGYLECNGQSVSTTTYPELFNAIGYTYGGSGASFTVPDLRGEFIRGSDNNRGLDAGRQLGTVQTDALQNIQGSIGNMQMVYGPTCSVDPLFSGSTDSGVLGSYNHCYGNCGQGSMDVNFDASKVARTSTETRPHNIALMPCIKY